MKAIEADKVEQAIKDYWKAQVNKLPKPKNIEEHDEYVNRLDAILEHNDGLLKAIDELPSAEQEAPDINVGSMDVISRTQVIEAIKRHKTAEQSQSGEVRNWTVDTCADAVKRLPSISPETNCSEIPNNSDTISRQQAIDVLNEQIEQCNKALGSFDISFKDEYAIKVEKASLLAYKEQLENLSSAQPFHNITMNDVLKYIDDMPEDVWQEFTACLECRGWGLQWCGGDFA